MGKHEPTENDLRSRWQKAGMSGDEIDAKLQKRREIKLFMERLRRFHRA